MSRRLIWIALGLVTAVLAGASMLADPAAWRTLWAPVAALPWRAWVDTAVVVARTAVEREPVLVGVAAAGGFGLLAVAIMMGRRARRRRDEAVPFREVLDDALAQEAVPAQVERPREQQVKELALAGHPVQEISRMTRLSQDAVRAVLARAG